MQYINSVPSAFRNMTYYINMWRDVLINEVFHKLGTLAHDWDTRAVEQAPPDLFEQCKYGLNMGLNIFHLDSYYNELKKHRPIRFRRRYKVGSSITRAEKRSMNGTLYSCGLIATEF